ncbi:hypothetical protein N8310_03355 [Pseudomonadota bacterium]|nr:hypothetical protein [Pseudomonadota bacterium]
MSTPSQDKIKTELQNKLISYEKEIAVLSEKKFSLITPQPKVILFVGIGMILFSIFLMEQPNNETASFGIFAIGIAALVYGYATVKNNKKTI